MSVLCSRGAAEEPLAGSAPTESHWLFVEAPGSWGREALAGGSLDQDQREALRLLPPHWRVVMVRRADRPLRRLSQRHVWMSTPEAARHWVLPLTAPIDPGMAGGGAPDDVLFLCTNGGRDRCCALLGRPLLDSLDADRVWECSHLGGHRFAATGVRLSDRMVFGRLDPQSARQVLGGGTPLDRLRGPAGWPPQVQAAAAAVWRHGVVPISAASSEPGRVILSLADGSRWQVAVRQQPVAPRQLSCGGRPEAGAVPVAEQVHRL